MRGFVVQYTPAALPVNAPSHGGIAFLDRDGVLNIGSPNYINTPSEFVALRKAATSVGELRRAGFRVCVVTNQSAILRGLWDSHRLHGIHNHMRDEFLAIDEDAHFDAVLACPHRHRDRCKCRKPMPGMLRFGDRLLRQTTDYPLGESEGTLEQGDGVVDWWGEKPLPNNPVDCMVGDRNSDMGAGWACGLRLFQVPDDVGVASHLSRILDLSDAGDSFNPVR
ncbi:HAD-IIIA family hydrolase [Candidatus Poseidoniaceae archaeon]|nr:HAD-IIIA family hydrolase [Candidatus Poseidoniaceae archaeon]MDA8844000.1 HAD-IIIA family hydrolase [Euryarchaeota archaeon]MDC3236273.1 HAD-IIIA family hydrolase [Candidatus Poseidoniaceae archaeon]